MVDKISDLVLKILEPVPQDQKLEILDLVKAKVEASKSSKSSSYKYAIERKFFEGVFIDDEPSKEGKII